MNPVHLPIQEPQPAVGASTGWLAWLAEFASRPGVVETLLASLAVALVATVWLRLVRVVQGVRSRAQLQDYLLGVEQALALDLDGAERRLTRVLEVDPENHFARLLLGKVLAQRGEPAQAHKHHLYLQRAFGVDSGDNDLHLARALLACGRPGEAADAAERVVAGNPQHAAALEFLFRARLQAGEAAAAAPVGRRLLALPGTHPDALRADVAAAWAAAGEAALRGSDVRAARGHLQEAERLIAGQPPARLLAARIDAAERGVTAAAERLLAAPREEAAAVAAAATRPLPLVPRTPPAVGAWLPVLAPLLPAGRWRCSACGAALRSAAAPCSRCAAQATAMVDEPQLFAAISAPGHVADAIEANEAHIRRTVRLALAAPSGEAGAPARSAALALGERAVTALLAAACEGDTATGTAAIGLLQQLGPSSTPALFAAADELEDRRLLPVGQSAVAHVVGRIVQGFDRTALPHVETLFASARPGSRKILIDYFVGLADLQEFQIVLERFPPLEILHRLNKIEGPVLRRFLQAVPADHFVAEVLLLDASFWREGELLAAIPGAAHPDVLERVLVQRGPSRTLTSELLTALGDARLQPVALRILRAFSLRVLDHVVSAFVDRDVSTAVHGQLAVVLTELGPPAVERLCATFGPEPTSLDDELLAVLVGMGDAAVGALQTAYGRPGLVERLTVGLFGRGGNRRTQIVRALAGIGTPAARTALQALRETESDANLKLRLQQALHRLAAKDTDVSGNAVEDHHGQVG